MIRLTLLWLLIAGASVAAMKDWYKGLCVLILLMAIIEHPDVPKSILGIQGLNPWNILLLIVILAWLSQRGVEGLRWDMPRSVQTLLLLYLVVILVSFGRMIVDREAVLSFAILRGSEIPSTGSLVSEHLINSLKWVLPGLLLFDGCRDRTRLRMGMGALLLVYFLLSVQVIKWMPLSEITGGDALSNRSLKILINEIGYHRVNLSMMLAGASWAIFASRELIGGAGRSLWMFIASFVVLFGQALTGGRMGYVTWALVGVVLIWGRWRRYLLLAPLAVAGVLLIVPGVQERLSQGFTQDTYRESKRFDAMGYKRGDGPDVYTVTAGRNIAWPMVIDKIKEAPLFGYGKEAMQRTGLSAYLFNNFREPFPHPHNAYLQLLLDNGLLGGVWILLFYRLIVKYSYQLFRDSRRPEFIAAGGCCLALVLALLVASMGSQSFYPREGAVGMWCAIGLMLRVYVQRSRLPEKSDSSNQEITDESLWGRIA